MKSRILSLLLLALLMCPVCQASEAPKGDLESQRAKVKLFKRQIITRELGLSRDVANKFFPIYEKMDEELERLGRDTHTLETRTINNATATDIDLETAARAIFEQKKSEGEIELRYFEKFRSVLSPRQLLKLKAAEREFRRQVIQYFKDNKEGE